MAKRTKTAFNPNKLYHLFSVIYPAVLGVTLCIEAALRERCLSLYNKEVQLIHNSAHKSLGYWDR